MIHEQLTEQFYAWERRGRGWQVFDNPASPEPPFRPFYGHYLPETPVIDDGRRPTGLSSLVQRLSQKLGGEIPAPPIIPIPEEEPEPELLIRDSLIELQTSLPASLNITRDAFEHFLLNLSLCREPIAFELLGLPERVTMQFAAHPADAPLVRRQLQAYFPEGTFQAKQGALANAWDGCEGEDALVVEFGLAHEFMLPLATGKLDPFVGLVGALAELKANELGLFQVLFQPVRHPWAENIMRSVTRDDGTPFFVNTPELVAAARNKVARPLYAAVVRIAVKSETFERALQIACDLAGSLRVFAQPQGNELIPLENAGYDFEEHIEDTLCRQSRRTGMLLNSDELTGFVHLPSSAVRSPVLQRETGKTKAAPAVVRQTQGIFLGDNEHAGESIPIYLSPDQRVRHTHIIGSSGTGKSSLLLSMIRQDIEKGEGVAVLDPAGDLIDQILSVIPEHRINDVVLVNPSDIEFPIGFNILQAHSEEEKNLLSSDLIAVFRRLSTSWGDQMDAVLQNAILAFLESSRGGTLADLRRFLLEPPYRNEFLQTVEDPEIIYYWQRVFPHLSGGKSIGPILTRLQDFFSRKPLRNLISQRENKLDFADIMDTGKIFLAKLSEGLLGKENSYLLGTLLISKFQQLAVARQAQNVATRRDFWIYIDEFHHFITPSMAEILQGARKYRIGLTLAHHELRQLHRDAEVASAVMTHPCTRIVFQVGDEDAKKLGECFESFDSKSLKTLEKFHAIARVERNDFDFNLSFRKPELPPKDQAEHRKDEVIAASRSKYATPRAQVEAALLASLGKAKPVEPAKSAEPPLPKLAPPVAVTPSVAPTAISEFTGSEKKEAVLVPAEIPKAEEASKDLGRGGAQHQAMQDRLKCEAHKRGFLAEVEKQLKKGSNEAADLVLRLGGLSVAVEIAVTTSINHEFENVRKCLDAGFARIAVISTNRKRLEDIAAAVQGGLGSEAAAKVGYHSPDEFIAELDSLAKTAKPEPPLPLGERKSHGRTVKRHFPPLTPDEARQKDDEIRQVLLDAMRRPKGT